MMTLPEQKSLQCIFVPHQKFGVFYFPPLSDEMKEKNMFLDVSNNNNNNDIDNNNINASNYNKLRSMFGITGGQSNAARTLALRVGEVQNNNNNFLSSDASSTNLNNLVVANNFNSNNNLNNNNNSGSTKVRILSRESLLLLKRIRALAIPPLHCLKT
jgi:hypothetical protein